MASLQDLLLTNELVITLRPKNVVPTPSVPSEPTSNGYDANVPSLLLSAFNNKLDAIGEPDLVQLAPIGFPFAYLAPIDGFARANSCYKWEGAIKAPVDGKYTFQASIKSAGYIIFDNDIKWNVDRESDPGSHSIFKPTFDVTLKAGQFYSLKAELVEQGNEHIFDLQWIKPGNTAAEVIPSLLCVPPSDWKTRIKALVPPVVIPPTPPTVPTVPTQPDFSKYTTPDLPVDLQVLPKDNIWNTKISNVDVDPNSANIIASLGTSHLHPGFGTGINGIPIQVIPAGTPKVSVKFDISDESDVGPYPIPDPPVLENAGIINGGNNDVHWIGISVDEKKIYEIYQLQKVSGNYTGYSGAIFDLTSNNLRKLGFTSADAAGLPIMPGLVRFQEVTSGNANHAFRVTVGKTRKAFVAPATHFASQSVDVNLPPMGCRLRLKNSVDITSYPPQIKTILQTLKDYGMFIADNGSPGFLFIIGTPDSRWDDNTLAAMKNLHASDFEVVKMGDIITDV